MAFDYTGLAGTATTLIAKFGRDVTLTKKGATSTTPGKPWEGGTATDTTSRTVKAVFEQNADSFKDDTRVRAADKVCLIDGTVKPEEGDKIADGGRTFEVIAANAIEPGDTPLAYQVAMRG